MKFFVALFLTVVSSLAFARPDFYSEQTKDCLRSEIHRQHPYYHPPYALGGVYAVVADNENFEYLVHIEHSGRVVGSINIIVRNGDTKVAQFLIEGLRPKTIDISACVFN